MVTEIPVEIQQTKQKIKLKKAEIAKAQRELEELVFLSNFQLAGQLETKLVEIKAYERQVYSSATQEIIRQLKKNNYNLLRIKENLTEAVSRNLFGSSRITSQLNSMGYYFVWQVAAHSEEYWSKALSPSSAITIRDNLNSRGLCLGVNYFDIFFLEQKNYDDFEEAVS